MGLGTRYYVKRKSLVFRSKRKHQKDILKLQGRSFLLRKNANITGYHKKKKTLCSLVKNENIKFRDFIFVVS